MFNRHLLHSGLLLLCLLFSLSGAVSPAAQEITGACPDAAPSRLITGEQGFTSRNQLYELYAEASNGAALLRLLPPYVRFDVLEGPRCSEDAAWWRIRYGTDEGWINESYDSTYVLEPLTPIRTSNATVLQRFRQLGYGLFTTDPEWLENGARIIIGSTAGLSFFARRSGRGLFPAINSFAPIPAGPVCDVETGAAADGAASNRLGYALCRTWVSDTGFTTPYIEFTTITTTPQYAERWYQTSGSLGEFEFISGSLVLAAAVDNEVRLLSGGNELLMVLWSTSNPVIALDVSANGAVLAASDGMQILLTVPGYSREPGLLETGSSITALVTALALNPDGTLLAVGVGTVLQLWDVEQRALLAAYDVLGIPRDAAARALDIAFSPDGLQLATANDDGTLTIWMVQGSGAEAALDYAGQIYPGIPAPITDIAFSPDGQEIASISRAAPTFANQLRIHAVGSGQVVAAYDGGHTGTVTHLAFSPDSLTIASAGEDATVRLWNTLSGTPTQIIAQTPVEVLAFSASGDLLINTDEPPATHDFTIDAGTQTVIWRDAEGSIRRRFPHDSAITALAVSPDAALLATGTAEGRLLLWDTVGGSLLNSITLLVPYAQISTLAFSPDGVFLAAAVAEFTLIYTIPGIYPYGIG